MPPPKVPQDSPRKPFLLVFERRPSVTYLFGLNPYYSCFQVSEFSLLLKKKVRKGKLSFPELSGTGLSTVTRKAPGST